MRRGSLYLIALAVLAIAGSCGAAEFRGIWVNGFSSGFKSASQVDQLLVDARGCHANAVVVEMRLRGNTFYPSSFEPWAPTANPSFDALAYLIQKAHGGTPRIEVHFWTPTTLISDGWPSDPNHPVNKYPQYLSKDMDGNTVYDGSYYFDPGNPGAEQYLCDVIMDVINRYDIDGFHFDYIRFPSKEFGYNDVSVSRFNAAYSHTGKPGYTDSDWCDWRRAQITNLVRKVYANAIAAKPNIKVSAATATWSPAPSTVSPWYSCAPYSSVLQDWRGWMEEGILDLNIPMDYFDATDPDYGGNYYTWLNYAADHQYNRMSAIGPALYKNTIANSIVQIRAARNTTISGHKVVGACLYDYATTNNENLSRSTFLNALVNPTGYDPNPTPVWRDVTTVPVMPWKATPTKGYVKGTITYGTTVDLDNVTVTISTPDNREIKTDGTGFYAFIDIAPGTYNVTATKSGYGTMTKPVTVTAGNVATVDMDFSVGSVIISSVVANSTTANSVIITWTTNATASSQIAYGTDKSCPIYTTEDPTQVTSHSVTLSGLNPMTPYYYKIISRNPTAPAAISDVYAFVTAPQPIEVIVDDPAASFYGPWYYGTASDKYGGTFRYAATSSSPTATALYVPNLPQAGNYMVYAWWPSGSSRTSAASYMVYYNGGSQAYTVNQQINAGKWNLLGTLNFAAGTDSSVQISNQSSLGGYVMADALKFAYETETQAPTNPVGVHIQSTTYNTINLAWTASTDSSGVAGYYVYRDGMVVGVSPTNSYSDTELMPNKKYTYNIAAYDIFRNVSGQSSILGVYTLAMPPSVDNVKCDKSAGAWQTSNPFTFSMVDGRGVGHLNYYTCAWDISPTHTWNGSEKMWVTGNLIQNAVSGPAPYYLHLRAYNDAGTPGGTFDLGPYYLDTTEPSAPDVTYNGQYCPSRTQVQASWLANDPDSGISGYQYAVGTTPGGTDLAGWTDPDSNTETITIPEQAPGAIIYISARACNGAGTWGGVGTSSAITIGNPVESVAKARELAGEQLVTLTNAVISAVFADCFYIQDDNRAAGIRVDAVTTLAEGSRVNVNGVISIQHDERQITLANVQPAP